MRVSDRITFYLCNNLSSVTSATSHYVNRCWFLVDQQFGSAYNIEGKYGEKNSDLLFSRKLKHNPFVSCNINNTKKINDIVKLCKNYATYKECWEWMDKKITPSNQCVW